MTADINDVLFPRIPKTKAQRRQESYAMLKCRCGNVAGLGETKCGRCRQADEPAPVDPVLLRALACIQEYRRLENKTVRDAHEVAKNHIEADSLLQQYPEFDDPTERHDAPHRVEHRKFVQGLFR